MQARFNNSLCNAGTLQWEPGWRCSLAFVPSFTFVELVCCKKGLKGMWFIRWAVFWLVFLPAFWKTLLVPTVLGEMFCISHKYFQQYFKVKWCVFWASHRLFILVEIKQSTSYLVHTVRSRWHSSFEGHAHTLQYYILYINWCPQYYI